MQVIFSVILNIDKFLFSRSELVLIADIFKDLFFVVVSHLLVTPRVHLGFQRIFNYRPEHLILVKPLSISRLYLQIKDYGHISLKR